VRLHGSQHVLRRRDRRQRRADGNGQGAGRADQRDFRTGIQRGLGQGVALLAGGAVGQVAHRVQGLLRPAGGDDHAPATQAAPAAKHAPDVADQRRGFRQPPPADHPRSKAPFLRLHHQDAPRAQGGQVVLRGGVLVHGAVHRRGDDDRAAGGQRRNREQVIGQPGGQPGQGVGGRRGDDQQVGVFAQADVGDVSGQLAAAGAPHISVGRAAGDRFEGEGADETLGGPGHDHRDMGAGLGQLAGQVDGLVDGDAAGDAQQDVPVFQDSDVLADHRMPPRSEPGYTPACGR